MSIFVTYGHEKHWSDDDNDPKRDEVSTVSCDCGSQSFHVNFIQAPYCGCYLKITCEKCGESDVLFDDYA